MKGKRKYLGVRDVVTGQPVACGVERVMDLLGDGYLTGPDLCLGRDDTVDFGRCLGEFRRVNGKWVQK
jgi:hypothetical protein